MASMTPTTTTTKNVGATKKEYTPTSSTLSAGGSPTASQSKVSANPNSMIGGAIGGVVSAITGSKQAGNAMAQTVNKNITPANPNKPITPVANNGAIIKRDATATTVQQAASPAPKMSDRDTTAITNYGRMYEEAKAKGDMKAAEAYHNSAEAIRSNYGFSGGADGTQVINNPQTQPQQQPEAPVGLEKQPKVQEQLPQSTKNIDSAMNDMRNIVGQLLNDKTNTSDESKAILANYLEDINGQLNSLETQVKDAYNNGLNDPGLQSALGIIREEAKNISDSLMEDLNARGVSQSGILIKAREDLQKNQLSQEGSMIGNFMSQLSDRLYNSIQNIVSQRVAVMSNFAGQEANLAMQDQNNRLENLRAAMSGVASMGQMAQNQYQFNIGTNLKREEMNTQKDQFNQTMTQNQNQFDAKMAQEDQQFAATMGLELSKFEEMKSQFKQTFGLSEKEFNEKLRQFDLQYSEEQRHNKASEGLQAQSNNIQAENMKINQFLSFLQASNDQQKMQLEADKYNIEKQVAVGNMNAQAKENNTSSMLGFLNGYNSKKDTDVTTAIKNLSNADAYKILVNGDLQKLGAEMDLSSPETVAAFNNLQTDLQKKAQKHKDDNANWLKQGLNFVPEMYKAMGNNFDLKGTVDQSVKSGETTLPFYSQPEYKTYTPQATTQPSRVMGNPNVYTPQQLQEMYGTYKTKK